MTEASQDDTCPRIRSKMQKEVRSCFLIPFTPPPKTLPTYKLDNLVVNLKTTKCAREKWDLIGIPYCMPVHVQYVCNKRKRLMYILTSKGRGT